MDETQEDTHPMPKLDALMNEPSIFEILAEFPPRKNVVITVTVTNEETGVTVERKHHESADIWPHLRSYEQGRLIRKVADEVAAQVDWERSNP